MSCESGPRWIGVRSEVRKLSLIAAVSIAWAGCDPTIKTFTVVPATLPCPGSVTLTWEGDADGGRLEADQPVLPPLPPTVLKQGTRVENVTKTTAFKFFYPSASERTQTVTVTNAVCPGACQVQTLLFTGQCTSAQAGPNYITVNVGAANAPGNLKQLTTDADFPVHAAHGGFDIALSAGGGPIFPLPAVPAAGDYTISVPGQVGLTICAGAGPTGGGTIEAPQVHLVVTPTCPQ